jgi:tetratricopeptide (TPR) repeat protein
MADKLQNRVLYLSVPESLRCQVEEMSPNGADFTIDPDIPIPVEIPRDSGEFNLDELSWEMIVAGMLRVIAEGGEKRHWIDYYRRFVLAVKPNITAEFIGAAVLKAKNGDFDLALEILDTLKGLAPFSAAVLLNRALVLEQRAALLERQERAEAESAFAEAAFQEAESAYEQILANPFPAAHYNAGFFFLGRKKFSLAKECFSRYRDNADDDEKKEKATLIIHDIEKNSLEDDNFREAYDLIRQGEEEAGMYSIREFIEKNPAVWNGWFVLGWALRRLGRWEEGAAAFDKAIEFGGGGSDTRNELAICLMESGDLKGARRQLEAALRGDPENVKIISNLAVLAMKNGNADEAAAFFRTVLELDPDDLIARKALVDSKIPFNLR